MFPHFSLRRIIKLHILSVTCLLLADWHCLLHAQPAPGVPWKLQTARLGMPAVLVQNEIYVLGGATSQGASNTVEHINIQTGETHQVTTKLLHRMWHTAQADGAYIYIMGGVKDADGPNHLAREVERYDTRTGEVQLMAPMPTPRRLATSVLVDGRIYVIGGSDQINGRVNVMEIYDINEDTWLPARPMPTARETTAVEKDGTIYVVGGFAGKVALPTVEAYNIAKGTWRKLPDMPWIMSAHHMAVVGDELYSFGDYAHLDFVCAYNFATGQWRKVEQTKFQPTRHAPVLSQDGVIYIIGGINSQQILDTVQVLKLDDLKD